MQQVREHPAKKHVGTSARSDLDALRQRRARSHYLTRLIVKTGGKVVILKTGDIEAIESAGNYVAVQLGKESHILRASLSALAAQLDPKKFLRISRSAIVNLDHVKELLPMPKGEQAIVLHNGKHFAMTLDLREAERA
ncbi:MAG TPA: LytTR family DNA-binding domain-containing protein, partial [Verrucomicrobiae bacterium]|nr:LytTR family DNA-binding domain-containing protein [Verrucomicrobiae bacterium]